jgi:hypothetical protein
MNSFSGTASAWVKALVQIIICEMAVLKLSFSMSSPTFLMVSWTTRSSSLSPQGASLISPKPHSRPLFLEGHAPDAGEEAGNAFDALHLPGFHLFERPHEHLVEAQRVGSVFFDHIVRVDHVAAGLGHLLAVLAEDQALVDQFLERLGVVTWPRSKSTLCQKRA